MFVQGGLYEGEWKDGNPDGVGMRTFRSGQMKVHFWNSSWHLQQGDSHSARKRNLFLALACRQDVGVQES